jgi:hypothetical protein
LGMFHFSLDHADIDEWSKLKSKSKRRARAPAQMG